MSVFGVDFGNLNSTVAITRHGGVDIVTNEVSKRETTTIVSFLDDERFIGEQGLDRYVRNAQNTVFLLKRFVGMRMSDPQLEQEKSHLTCQIQAGEDDRLMFGVNYCGELKYFYPEQVLAMMLQRLRTYVNDAATVDPKFRADVRDCVITVPSYYTADQRRLVYQAAEVAGLNCMSLINETTATAVDYGIFRGSTLKETEEEAQIVGVLDIGYAATDFSITKFWRGNCKILARTFDANNGTRDIDYELYKYMVKEVQTKYKVDVSENRRARLRLLQGCERLKYLLSANSSAPLNIENVMDVDINIACFERSTLEELAKGVLERVKSVIERGFAEAGIEREKFHSIEMIGGGCRIPMLKRLVEEALGRPPSFTLNASEATARGCAIMAAMLSPKFQVREFKMAEIPTYPILLGYHVENPKSPSSVSFLPDVNKVVTLLGPKDSYPKLLDVTIPRSGPFKLYAFYNPDHPNVQVGVRPGHYVIGEWEIGAPLGKVRGSVNEVKVRINVRPDGLLQVESATALDSFEEEVEVEVKKAKKEGETAAPDAAAAATAPADGEAKTNEEEKPADSTPEVEKQIVKKRKTRHLECTVQPNISILGHSGEAVVGFRKAEKEMHDRDVLITSTREKKNELESYILDFRPKLSEGGMLAEYVTPQDSATFIAQCDADEQWLYGDGESADLAAYQARVDALRSIGDAALARHRNLEDVSFAIKGFRSRMEEAAQLCDATVGKKDHITTEDLDKAKQTALDAIAWADSNLDAMLNAPKTAPWTMTTRDMDAKAGEVTRTVKATVNKPAPPPPKPDPKPAAPAKPEEGNANEEAAQVSTDAAADPVKTNEEEEATAEAPKPASQDTELD